MNVATPQKSRSELSELLRLSAPLIVSHAGNQLMGLVDTAMVGRLGAASLGGVGVGASLFFAITVVGMGIILGLDPIIAQALGAGERDRARRALWQGYRIALVISVPLMALIALSSLLLGPIGIEAETASEARRFMFGRLPNVIPFLLFTAARSYLQAAGGTRTIILAMIAANITNVAGNMVLIYGDAGLAWLGLPGIGAPALGVVGSGLASSLASVVSFIIVARGVAAIEAPADPERRTFDRALVEKIFKLGTPIGLQLVAEVGAFGLLSILAARMGKLPAAGYQVAIMLASLSFTVTLGIASATSVQVGRAVGRSDTAGARRAGFMGMGVGATFMAFTGVAFFVVPEIFARLLTNQPEVIAAAAPLIRIAGVFQISDGLQAVSAGALRGAGETRMLHRANLVGHYVIGLPIAVLLGFYVGLGAPGLWWGATVGLTVVAAFLTYRFHRISLKPLARV
jgi:multidrug resistance protein, MATE family